MARPVEIPAYMLEIVVLPTIYYRRGIYPWWRMMQWFNDGTAGLQYST